MFSLNKYHQLTFPFFQVVFLSNFIMFVFILLLLLKKK